MPDTYVLRVRDGSLEVSIPYPHDVIYGSGKRAELQATNLQPVAQWIDDFEAVHSIHDSPQFTLGWDHYAQLVDHAKASRRERHNWLCMMC